MKKCIYYNNKLTQNFSQMHSRSVEFFVLKLGLISPQFWYNPYITVAGDLRCGNHNIGLNLLQIDTLAETCPYKSKFLYKLHTTEPPYIKFFHDL